MTTVTRQVWMDDKYWEQYQLFLSHYFGSAAKDRYGTATSNYRSTNVGTREILQELIENPPDAEATRITLVIYPKLILVIDNGFGMVPGFTHEGLGWANERIKAIDTNTLGTKDDLRALITDVTLNSLLWAATWAGMSAKAGRRNTTGYRGVGIQSTSQLGEPVEFITRPRADKAAEFYTDPELAKNPPVYRWVMPTLDQIQRRQIEPDIEPYDAKLFVDHNGQSISHGTIVKINNLKSSVLDSLVVSELVRTFQSRYGAKIRSGALEIEIVDRFSTQGKATPGGLIIKVPPAQYKGFLIVDRSGVDNAPWLFVRSGGKSRSFGAQIYWNPDRRTVERGDGVKIRQNGFDRNPITSVLPDAPWNIIGLNGYVEFPEEEIDSAGKTSQEQLAELALSRLTSGSIDKKVLADSPLLRAWKAALKPFEESIPDAIKKYQAEINRQAGDDISKELASTLKEAIADDPELAQVINIQQIVSPNGRNNPVKTATPRGSNVPIPPGYLHIQVIDEHRTGLSGVPITITRSKTLIANLKSQGSADLVVNVGPGTYAVEIELQSGWKLEEMYNPLPITLAKGEGKKIIFHVIAGAPLPNKSRRWNNFHLFGEPFGADKADRTYDDDLLAETGAIRYNTAHPKIEELLTPGNENRLRSVLGKIVTDSVGHTFLAPHFDSIMVQEKEIALFIRMTRGISTEKQPKR